MIKFRCSHCNKKFGVPDDYAGKRIRCNTCDHHTIVPKSAAGGQADGGVTVNPTPAISATDKPAELLFKLQPDSPDEELITTETLLGTPKSTDADIQLQSFHHFTPSDSVTAETDAKPAAKNTVSQLLKRCRPDPRTDRMELALNTLSFISCIGPFIFIIFFIIFLTAMAGGSGDSAGAIPDPNSSAADPNTVSAPNPFKFLPPVILARYAFYAISLVISPLALIASMVIVIRYSYDMPKSLYFSIVIHGLIFFSIFQG